MPILFSSRVSRLRSLSFPPPFLALGLASFFPLFPLRRVGEPPAPGLEFTSILCARGATEIFALNYFAAAAPYARAAPDALRLAGRIPVRATDAKKGIVSCSG